MHKKKEREEEQEALCSIPYFLVVYKYPLEASFFA